MGLDDDLLASDRYAEIKILAENLIKREGVEVVPMLVVEGEEDENVFRKFCVLAPTQVRLVHNKDNVEGVIREFRLDLPPFLELAGLTDCDAVGKAPEDPKLRADPALVVTQGCDLEADLFLIGAVERALEALNVRGASDLAARAMDMAVPISALRRGAHAEGIGMTIPPKKHRLRFAWLDDQAIEACASAKFEDALDAVSRACAERLGWRQQELIAATAATTRDGVTFASVGSGKDAFDALSFLSREINALKDLQPAKLIEHSARQVRATDFAEWHVGRRLTSWQDATGVQLINLASDSLAKT